MKNRSLRIDWAVYNMILFNILQNAIKYNVANGKITIELDMLYNNFNGSQIGDSGRQGSEAREFSTKIIDTGVGIEPERLRHLFKPYGELLCFGKLKLVKHHGIGLGLSNSKSFINFLGGSIRITKSEPARSHRVVIQHPIKPRKRSNE